MTVAAIHQPQYLPYLGFFHKLANCDVFVTLDEVQFQWRGVQHRNRIKTKQGWQWLTVPVLHRSRLPTRVVEIDPTEPWQRRHRNAIRANYARAPYHSEYGEQIQGLLEQRWSTICDLDVALVRLVMEILDIRTPLVFQSELGVEGRSSDLLVNICKTVGADRYLSGPGGRRYMDPGVFQAAGVEILWQEFSSPVYQQVFPEAGFVPDLSVVDALFCCGLEIRRFLG